MIKDDSKNYILGYEELHKGYPLHKVKAPPPITKGQSDGGPSEYYDFPKECTTLNDLIEFKDMSFAQGNIFKATYRLGNKEGISLEYDLKKIKYYVDRMLNQEMNKRNAP